MNIKLTTGDKYRVNNCTVKELMQVIGKHDSLGINFVLLDVNVVKLTEWSSEKRYFNINHIVEIWQD